MRTTHTYANLEVSSATHKEIADKLDAAGYDRIGEGGVMDMEGIALVPKDSALMPPSCRERFAVFFDNVGYANERELAQEAWWDGYQAAKKGEVI